MDQLGLLVQRLLGSGPSQPDNPREQTPCLRSRSTALSKSSLRFLNASSKSALFSDLRLSPLAFAAATSRLASFRMGRHFRSSLILSSLSAKVGSSLSVALDFENKIARQFRSEFG